MKRSTHRRFGPCLRLVLLPLTLIILASPLRAAPLFPDVPDGHWAQDAVASLASKGLVEGYPDGTFKGDRAMSRWEVAAVVARLLANWESTSSTFATKQELQQVRSLVNALSEELAALGVRVTALEEKLTTVDRRVSELERITFYGRLETRVVGQTFQNNGQPDNDDQRAGGGLPGTVPYLNYNNVVGTASGPPLRPQMAAAMPVVNYANGRGLTNGTGFSSLAVLGIKLAVSPDIDAGMELAAYTSAGDRFVDGYWGVSAPYLSNPTTANAAGGDLTNAPYTKMMLDNFWVQHKPSKTRLRVGTLDQLSMDKLVYRGQPNLGVYGPAIFPGYGFRVDGQRGVGQGSTLQWEVFGSRFGHGVVYAPLGTGYQNNVLGADLAFEWDKGAGAVRLNWVRVNEEQPNGLGLGVGLTNNLNVAYGASSGWSIRQWVNPPGDFALQRSAYEQANTGALPNTVDTRPVPGWNGTTDDTIGMPAGAGNYGPQQQNTLGLSAHYKWAIGDKSSLRANLELATSDYRPSHNSSYNSSGQAGLLSLLAGFRDENLLFGLDYISVDPNYNPASWANNLTGLRFPRTANFTGTFHLHDFINYPHNREGFRLNGTWKFAEKKGQLWARYADLEQTRTSLYDVRVTTGALGPGTPTSTVIGFAPGFVDSVFSGFANPLVYGAGTANSFTDGLAPFENPRGHEQTYALGGGYSWAEPKVSVKASFEHTDFDRHSGLTPQLGGSQNEVRLATSYLNLETAWEPTAKWKLFAGLDRTNIAGHLDPAGDFNAFANAIGSNSFTNIDSTQSSPYLGFDNKLTESTSWGLQQRYYDTVDHVGTEVRASRAFDQVGSTAHDFSWSGWQTSGTFTMKF